VRAHGLALERVADKRYSPEAGNQYPGRSDCVAKCQLVGRAGRVDGKRQASHGRFIDRREHYRRFRPQLSPPPYQEFERSRPLCDDDTDRRFAELVAKICTRKFIVSRPTETTEIEMLREDGDARRRFGVQYRSKGGREGV